MSKTNRVYKVEFISSDEVKFFETTEPVAFNPTKHTLHYGALCLEDVESFQIIGVNTTLDEAIRRYRHEQSLSRIRKVIARLDRLIDDLDEYDIEYNFSEFYRVKEQLEEIEGRLENE